MGRSIIKKSAGVIALAAASALLGGAPAFADTFSVTVTPTTGIPAAGGDVTVALAGLPSGEGVYVVQCAATAVSPRPTTSVNCASANQRWMTLDSTMWGFGGEDAAAPLTFHALPTFRVSSTTFDCRVTSCALFVRRDHMGSADFSLDTLVPLAFVSAVPTDVLRFGAGGAGLTWAARAALESHLSAYTSADAVTISVTVAKKRGMHTLRARHLASARAGAIRDYLVAHGVTAGKVSVYTSVVRQGRASRAVVTTTTYPPA